MRKLLLVTALGLAANVFATDASAADDSRFYLRGTVGQTNVDSVGDLLEDNGDTAYGIDFGWRILPWLSLEGGYNDLGDYQVVCGAEVCPAVVLPRLELDSIELGLQARVPFGDSGVYGQARAGMHRWDVGFGDHENDPYYGVGVGYKFNDRFSLSLNYDIYETEGLDVDRVGLGFEVSF